MLSVASLCMMAALSTQMMHNRQCRKTLRLVLGLEIFRAVLMLCGKLPKMI